MKQTVSVVIADLDNTLFDWFEIWYNSFNAMLTSLVDKSGIRYFPGKIGILKHKEENEKGNQNQQRDEGCLVVEVELRKLGIRPSVVLIIVAHSKLLPSGRLPY